MIYTFKSNGIRAAVDSRDGSVRLLDNLTYLLLSTMQENPAPEMPTSLRYAFAKYDGAALQEAYKTAYSLFTQEKIFTQEKERVFCDSASSVTVTVYEDGMIQKRPTATADVVCTEIKGIPSENEIDDLKRALVAAEGTASNRILKAPLSAIDQFRDNGRRLFAVVSATETAGVDLSAYDGVELRFSSSDNLTECVLNLFDKGISTISAYPFKDYPEAAAQYEKLARDILRYRKKGGKGVFAPFTFDFYHTCRKGRHLQFDITGKPVSNEEKFTGLFTEYYVKTGALAHLTDAVNSVDVINKCVECAICLSAEESS